MSQIKNPSENKKTIRQQIIFPFIIIVTLVPLLITLTFNIAFNIYVDKTTHEELVSTRNNAYSLMKAALSSGELKKVNEQHSVSDTAQLLISALTASRLSGNTDFLLLYQGKIAYPKNLKNSIIDKKLAMELDIANLPTDDKVYVRKAGNTSYYLTATLLGEHHDFPEVTMLFAASTASYENMILTLNLYLFIAIIIITAIAIVIFSGISKKISKPITYASGLATKIGNGEFVNVPIDYGYTEIYKLTSSLNTMSHQLKEAESVQKKFLQNASHELRTPLMSIQGYAEGIEKDIVTDVKSAAAIIHQESIRMKKLVDELLTLSRIENQTHQIRLFEKDLNLLIMELIKGIAGMAMQNNIRLNTHLEDNIFAKIDETLFSQMILNILSNCIRYAKTEVTIFTSSKNNHAVVTIEDDGAGFSNEDMEHIFDRFYKGKGGNFGLGMAIVAGAAKSMNASISVSNTVKKGAKFEIQF